MIKKIIILLIPILLLVGCESTLNTPTSKVESFLHKYQMLDKNVLLDLDNIVDKDKNLNKKQKEEYKKIIKRQYQNLSYKIKSEDIENNVAIVETEIEVLDYSKVKEKEMNKRIKKLQQVEEKKKYELTFYLTKNNGLWIIDTLDENDHKKINGMY